jgi:hypothetical protein
LYLSIIKGHCLLQQYNDNLAFSLKKKNTSFKCIEIFLQSLLVIIKLIKNIYIFYFNYNMKLPKYP